MLAIIFFSALIWWMVWHVKNFPCTLKMVDKILTYCKNKTSIYAYSWYQTDLGQEWLILTEIYKKRYKHVHKLLIWIPQMSMWLYKNNCGLKYRFSHAIHSHITCECVSWCVTFIYFSNATYSIIHSRSHTSCVLLCACCSRVFFLLSLTFALICIHTGRDHFSIVLEALCSREFAIVLFLLFAHFANDVSAFVKKRSCVFGRKARTRRRTKTIVQLGRKVRKKGTGDVKSKLFEVMLMYF